MKYLFRRFALISLLTLIACSSLPYSDDTGFLVSAQANSPEFPVYVNGSLCKDMDGNPGLCSKRIKSTDDVHLHFDAQSYAYDLTVSCTDPMQIPGASVPSGQAFDLTLPNASFSGMKSFVCIGEVFPQDRSQPLSAKWEIRVVISDAAYVAREAITFTKDSDGSNYLVLGQYARQAWVYDGSSWSRHDKETMIKVDDPTKIRAYSESYAMRFNYLNMDGPAQ